jgi:hypothetical protein
LATVACAGSDLSFSRDREVEHKDVERASQSHFEPI